MKPRGLLMIEHRLIEKMLKIVEAELAKIRESRSIRPGFIDATVDFIRTYADRTHHGKEEDILFVELGNKDLDPDNLKIMKDLVSEHVQARERVRALVQAKERFLHGDRDAWEGVAENLSWLTEFYPVHIKKEDAVFFPNTEAYFSATELEEMISRFHVFDAGMIHEKYRKTVEEYGKPAFPG
jgi:hemerythrin-like domain-containing protein